MKGTDASSSDMAPAAPPGAAQPPEPLLDVSGLAKRYGDQLALADVCFSAHAGEVLGLIGPNGAGKTTLLETIAGILPSDAGEALWRGAPPSLPQRREVMFYLPAGLRPWEDPYAAGESDVFAP